MSALIGRSMVGGYGGDMILNGCTIEARAGEIAVIVGPNGAGKSTAMKALFGMLDLVEGNVELDGVDITRLPAKDRVGAGMSFVPQTDNVFTNLTVLENLEMGAVLLDTGFRERIETVFDLFPAIYQKRSQPAGQLSGGQRQQVAVGRALMTGPKVLLLDEPTAGVSPNVVEDLFIRIQKIAQTGLAVLMVEQNAKRALEIADIAYVLVQGANRHTGRGAEILGDADVRRTFLGG